MYFIKGRRKHTAVGIIAAILIGGYMGTLPGVGTVKLAKAAEENPGVEQSAGPIGLAGEESLDAVSPEPSGEPEATEAPEDILQITELQMIDNTKDSITLSWLGSMNAGLSYQIYRYQEETGQYDFIGDTRENYFVCSGLEPAKKYYYVVRVCNEETGMQGDFSERLETYTKPKKVSGLAVKKNKVGSISLSWKLLEGAAGYEIYRALPGEAFVLVGTSLENAFTDSGLDSGTTYRYKVHAYAYLQENTGAFSSVVRTTTLPSKPVVKVKGGENKARVTWNAVTGATGYYLYWHNGTEYQYIATLLGKSSTSYVHINLQNNEYSKYQVVAYRVLDGTEYKGSVSDAKKALVKKQKGTVTSARLFKTKAGFQKSDAYKDCIDFQKKVKYDKSYIIPGLAGTNTDGFYSSNMCPQGLAFAKSYMLISAYDRKSEENSVIYVLDKSKKKLLLTMVLPNKTHAGGITYDGYNIWVTQSKKVHAIPLAELEEAVAAKEKTVSIEYKVTCELTHAASALTYYKGLLWVASYDELSPGYLGAYNIVDKKEMPTLTKQALIRITTRVQGLAFSSDGKLILSRSCQTDAAKRGFIHVLDVYKPKLSGLSQGDISLGNLKKTVEMPSMNEEIAISGKYLYVNYESAAFSSAVKKMDRVCAFKTTAITE